MPSIFSLPKSKKLSLDNTSSFKLMRTTSLQGGRSEHRPRSASTSSVRIGWADDSPPDESSSRPKVTTIVLQPRLKKYTNVRPHAFRRNTTSLHRLLQYTQDESLIQWDLRQNPVAAVAIKTGKPISFDALDQFATNPPVSILYVTCDVFPFPWRIEAFNPEGVSVYDLLEAIHTVVRTPIRREEWERLSEKQRRLTANMFEQRWMSARDPKRIREHGITRGDCLLNSTGFAGLSMSCETPYTCILTLSRRSRCHHH